MEVKFNSSEEKQQKEKKKKERKPLFGGKLSFNTLLSFVAYIAIGCIAVAMLLILILKDNPPVVNVLSSIGEAIAYIICIILAFSWVKTHKTVPWIVCYVVFVVTIVVLFILTIQF